MTLKKANKIIQIFILTFLVSGGFFAIQYSQASIRKEFNYQGKLTDGAGTNVADGAYDVVFKVYAQAGGGAAAWTESWTADTLFAEATTTMANDGCATGVDKITYVTGTNEGSLKAGQTLWNTTTKQSAVIESVVPASNYICIYDSQTTWTSGNGVTNRIYVKNGLFSAMVGSITDQTVQFTGSTYYLGVTVGADNEMIPRKKMGSVPQAWNANSLQGDGAIDIDNNWNWQDAANINYSPASGTYDALSVTYGSGGGTGTALSIRQDGTGNIVDFKDGATSVFTISDGGNVTMNALSFTQNAVNPVHIAAIFDDANTLLVGSRSIFVQGKYAYVASRTDNSVEILDISDPTDPAHIGSIADDGANTALDSARSIYVQGKYAYVAAFDDSGLEILDVSNPSNPTHVSSFYDDGSTAMGGAYSVYVQGKYAYVAGYTDSGIAILDISNPANPIHVGSLSDNGSTLMGGTYDVFVQGKYAYVVGNTENGIEILDISNPAVPTHVGSIADDGTNTALDGAYSIYVSGRYAYVASRDDNGVEIIDVSNPAAPTHVGVIYDDANTALSGASFITVSGRYAYVTALTDSGVEVLDVSDPANPTHAGAIFDDGTTALSGARTLYVQGKYAYVTGYPDNGVEVLQISGFDLPSASIGDLAASNLDVTDSANIAGNLFVGNGLSVGSRGIYSAGEITGYASSTSTALSITQNSTGNIVDFKDGAVSVFTISDGGNITMSARSFTQNAVDPVHKGSIADDGTNTALAGASSVYVQGRYAYVASSTDNGVEIVDVSNPASPAAVGKITDDGANTALDGASSIFVAGKYAYVTAYDDNGLEIVDVSNPKAPVHVGMITDTATTLLAGARSVYVSGKYAYVASYGENGIEIIDVSNPASPTHIASYLNNGSTALAGAHSVYVQGKYAYLTGETDGGMTILDISDPANPTHAGSIFEDGIAGLLGPSSVYVSGRYVYIASNSSDAVEVVDVSNPATPIHAGAIWDDTTSGLNGAHSIYVSGKYAYVAGIDSSGVEVLDISSPTPVHAGTILDNGSTLLGGANSIFVQGKYAYVTSGSENGLEILEIAGFDLPSANIGDLNVGTLDVTDNANVANNLYVGNSLNVGAGGIYSAGPSSFYANSTATALTVSQSGTGNLIDVLDTGVSIFKVGQATVDITRPLDLQVEGDVGMEYNLSFLNNATSYINSSGPLTISAGDTNSYENLTLTTSGTGDVVIDVASSLLGFRVLGAAGQVFSIDNTGNVLVGGVDTGNGNLTVKGNTSTQGGNLDLNALATPSSITVAPVGTAGSTTYGYRISAINTNGQTLASATTTTTTGNATLSATNYNRVAWGAVAGATSYKVYGRTSGSELLMATVNSPTLYLNDTGALTPSGALPTTNNTGGNNITYSSTDGPKRSIILTAAGAETPTTNGAAQTKVSGSNHTYYVLDFDATTDESAYWHWTMPDSYDGGKIDITYYWEAAATSAEVGWCFQAVGIAANSAEDIDVALSSAVCEVDTAQANANDLASVTEAQATANFAAGEYVAFKVFRDADQSTVGAGNDDMANDARLVKIKIEYSVNAESD